LQPSDGVATTCGTRRDDFGVARILRRHIFHPLEMIIIRMVRVEIGSIG
jgi:hypothetical protein